MTLEKNIRIMAISTGREVNRMYSTTNFQTKKALKEAVANGEQIGIFQPGPFGGKEPTNGTVCLEGPHYPQPHKWYAEVTITNGIITKVK